MPEIGSYKLTPTRLVPNSPYPLIHYAKYFSDDENAWDASRIHKVFARNDWRTQWIYRYGPTQPSHYHSATHECMAVLSGSATIRFGVADTEAEPELHAQADSNDDGEVKGGVELQANTGDAFLIPAGVSHKTFDPLPAESTFALLTPGDGHGIAAGTKGTGDVLAAVDLSGFTMLGAYPQDSVWDFSIGGDHVGGFEEVWAVPKPRLDPILGTGSEGLCGVWR